MTVIITLLPLDKMAAVLADFGEFWLKFLWSFFFPRGPIDNNPVFVHKMAWRWIGARPLSEPMLTRFIDTYMQYWGEMS